MNPDRSATHLLRIAGLAVFLLLTGCSSPELEMLQADSKILAFGDSLTFGTGANRGSSYPAVLSGLTGLEVINAGVPGETTNAGLTRLERALGEVQPDLLILIEGGNDILQNLNLAETKSNLAAMIESAKSRDIAVILLGVPEKKLFSNAAPLYEELATEHQLVFDGALIAGLLRSPSLKSDPVHLNEQGYKEMAESIHELLIDSGAIDNE